MGATNEGSAGEQKILTPTGVADVMPSTWSSARSLFDVVVAATDLHPTLCEAAILAVVLFSLPTSRPKRLCS